MERQETERVTDRQVIKSRQKKFFAFCLAILIGCMPTVNVMAATTTVNKDNIGNINGSTFVPGDMIRWEVAATEATGGRLRIYYSYNGSIQQEQPTGVVNPDNFEELTIGSYNVMDLLHWRVVNAESAGLNGRIDLEAVLRKAGGDNKEDDDSDDTPFIYNPDALAAVYYENGVPSWKAKFGKQTQGAACAMAFKNALPAGWKEGITFSMSVEDKYTYDPKTGTLVLCVPDALQKTGRQYAVMGIDKNGKVTVFYDTDNKPFLFTSKLNLEGYAFALIYKEP